MSKVTSICGMPRGAGGMSERSNLPSDLLSVARSRSPCSTWIVTPLWLSSAVEKTCEALVGIVVFFSIRRVITPPSVSMPSDSGVTSSSSTSLTSPASTPPWIAAPTATASSGLTSLRGSLPKKSFTAFCTSGMRVWPPTRITSSTSLIERPASLSAMRQGSIVRLTEVLDERLELGARELQRQVLGTRGVRRDVRQVDLGLLARGQLDLRLLRGFLQALHGERVLAHVDAALLLELGRDVVDHARGRSPRRRGRCRRSWTSPRTGARRRRPRSR